MNPTETIFQKVIKFIGTHALYIAFIQGLVAFLGSMYYSNVAGFPPCTLCWYQRIAMFPLFILLMIGILRKDQLVHLYIFPLAWIGWIISLYHNLLYYKWIPDTLAPCSTGVSCTTKYIEYANFITIPLMAFTAFSVIIVSMYIHRQYTKQIPKVLV
jgi:disulfide bond formation protein DsbB